MRKKSVEHTTSNCRTMRRGGSCAEFAVALPVLLYIVVGIVDLGRYAFAYITITNAASNGASYGAASVTASTDTAGISSAALADTTNLGTAPAPSVLSWTEVNAGHTNIFVRVRFPFTTITRFPVGTINMQRITQMRVLGT